MKPPLRLRSRPTETVVASPRSFNTLLVDVKHFCPPSNRLLVHVDEISATAPDRRVKNAMRLRLQAGVRGDGCHVGESASARLDSSVILSLSLSRYLTDILCSEDESHTFYNLQKKRKKNSEIWDQ